MAKKTNGSSKKATDPQTEQIKGYMDVLAEKFQDRVAVIGLATVWVNRSQGKAAATRHSDVAPHLEVPDLRTLAKLAQVL